MTSRDSISSAITPEVLLRAYACGIFPMAESADDPTLFWVEPEMRGLIPLDGFRVSSRLGRTVRSGAFTVTVDTAFKAVIAGCAAPQTAGQTIYDTESTYVAAQKVAIAYASLPRCPAPAAVACSDQAVVTRIDTDAHSAKAAILAAQQILADTKSTASDTAKAQQAAADVVNAFSAETAALKTK